jgi:hypothetical protein
MYCIENFTAITLGSRYTIFGATVARLFCQLRPAEGSFKFFLPIHSSTHIFIAALATLFWDIITLCHFSICRVVLDILVHPSRALAFSTPGFGACLRLRLYNLSL